MGHHAQGLVVVSPSVTMGAAPWLPPSVKAREDVLLRVLAKLQAFLPIRRVTVEFGRFDLQKLRDPDIGREAFQRRPRYGHDSTLAALVAAYVPRCAYCGGPGPLTIDHVWPRSRGGTNARENLLPACRACNQANGNRTPEEWGVMRYGASPMDTKRAGARLGTAPYLSVAHPVAHEDMPT